MPRRIRSISLAVLTLAGVNAVVATSSAWPTSTSSARAVAPAPASASGRQMKPSVIFGAYVEPLHGQSYPQAIQALESSIGRQLAAIRVYDMWDQTFPNQDTLWMRDTGHAIFLSVRAKTVNGTIVKWRDIANAKPGSSIYDRIITWAKAVKGFGARVYFTFNHEPEARSSDPNGTGADFIAAWRRIIDLFRSQGVTNAEYVWIVTDWGFARHDNHNVKYYYPGDAWVDDIAADTYNWNDCRGFDIGWRSLESLINPMRKFGLKHPTKHLMLTEWGSVEDPSQPGRKAQWIADAQQLLESPKWSNYTAALYYDAHDPGGYPNCNWRLDTSASAMQAFAAMGDDRYYQATAPPPHGGVTLGLARLRLA